MTEQALKELKSKYPAFLSDIHYIDCNDGWKGIVDQVCSRMSPCVTAAQIKEKYGGLRVYVYGATSDDEKVIDEFEEKSYTVCEECGQPGTHSMSNHGWEKTVCVECGNRLGFVVHFDDDDTNDEEADE